jgi:hypothetical protein
MGEDLPVADVAEDMRFGVVPSVSGRGVTPRFTFSSTILYPTCRPKLGSVCFRLLFPLLPLPLLERVETAFLPFINDADGGGSIIHALSFLFAGTVLTTGG